jgi:hypothetical protein
MQVRQISWSEGTGWEAESGMLANAQLVLVFGEGAALRKPGALDWLRREHPKALLFGCSTAGEIHGEKVLDDSITATAIHFANTRVRSASLKIGSLEESRRVGAALARAIPHGGLRHAFVLSDGLQVNGSELVAGLSEGLPRGVTVTGGLSGDGPRFGTTHVLGDHDVESGLVAILGFYGDRLTVGYGSLGGWDPFGPERLITRSAGNVLYELDGQSALTLYRRYLGEHAGGLPASGLLFPLSLRVTEGSLPVVRTILAINDADQSMTFAGDVPEGSYARLMKANFDRLVDGAINAAVASQRGIRGQEPELAILISCVGRKLVLKQRVEEEVEGVRSVLGKRTVLTGFYSYGEISPFTPSARCELHNQTMTITTLAEAA